MPRERVVVGGRASCLSTTILSSMLPHRSAAPPFGVPVVKLFAVVKLNGVPYNPGVDTPRFASFARACKRDTYDDRDSTPPARDGGGVGTVRSLSLPSGDSGGGKGRCARTKKVNVFLGFDKEVTWTILLCLSLTDQHSLCTSCMIWNGIVYRAVFGSDARPMTATARKEEYDRICGRSWLSGLKEHAAAQRETEERACRAQFELRRKVVGYEAAVDEQAVETAKQWGSLAALYKQQSENMPDFDTIDGGSLEAALAERKSMRRQGFRCDLPFRIDSEPSTGMFWVMFDEEDCDGNVSKGYDLQDEVACGHVKVAEFRASLAASMVLGKQEATSPSFSNGPTQSLLCETVVDEYPVSQDSINQMIAVDGHTGSSPGSGMDISA